MKQYVYEVLQEASKKTSETDKVKVLRDNESWALKDILRGTLDSTVEWNLPKGEPPYIKSDHSKDHNHRYQSIFAAEPGAVAAPTASLHFSEETFTQLREKQIEIIYITLHIGLGTFNPIISNNIIEHKMHKESYKITKETAKKLNELKSKNCPIFAIGTTVARCLESNLKNDLFMPEIGSTNLFIYPGYKFKVIDKLITNFHLPKSSLLILVSSFSTKNKIKELDKNGVKFVMSNSKVDLVTKSFKDFK